MKPLKILKMKINFKNKIDIAKSHHFRPTAFQQQHKEQIQYKHHKIHTV